MELRLTLRLLNSKVVGPSTAVRRRELVRDGHQETLQETQNPSSSTSIPDRGCKVADTYRSVRHATVQSRLRWPVLRALAAARLQ
jgi:hypothetical protein